VTVKIDTMARRRKLPVATHPVWASIGDARSGLKLGYRKGARGGVWIGKLVTAGVRVETTLGPADDGADRGLTHTEAVAAVIAWAGTKRARLATQTEDEASRVTTVANAVRTYVKARIARDPRHGRDAETRLARHVLGDTKLASLPVGRVTARALSEWRASLPAALSAAGINRLLNDFRAALNLHVASHWRELPATVGKEIELGLKALPGTSGARQALLSDADIRKIIESAYDVDPDLGALVLVLAGTGARFSQAARITIADFQPKANRVMVPASGKGRNARQRAYAAVPLGPDSVERLERLTVGRSGHAPLLMRWISRQVGPIKWVPVERAAWSDASQMLGGWKKTLAMAGVPYVEPYSLRHSSIVRGLRSGVPVRIVAALHDTSSAMIERYYSAFILDAADELARRAIVPLVSPPATSFSVVASSEHH
jgi:integrase